MVHLQGRRFPLLPADVEGEICGTVALESLLNDPRNEERWWGPLRRGLQLFARPIRADAHFNADCSCYTDLTISPVDQPPQFVGF